MHPRSSSWFSFRVFASRGVSPVDFLHPPPFKPSLKCDVANYWRDCEKVELKEREKRWIVQFFSHFLLHIRAPIRSFRSANTRWGYQASSFLFIIPCFLSSTLLFFFFSHLIYPCSRDDTFRSIKIAFSFDEHILFEIIYNRDDKFILTLITFLLTVIIFL